MLHSYIHVMKILHTTYLQHQVLLWYKILTYNIIFKYLFRPLSTHKFLLKYFTKALRTWLTIQHLNANILPFVDTDNRLIKKQLCGKSAL